MVKTDLHLLIMAKDARSFYDAFLKLYEKQQGLFSAAVAKHEMLRKKTEMPGKSISFTGQDMDLSSPAFMCLAFSLELHIKLLLKIRGIKKRGHDALKLIKALPKEDIDLLSNSDHLYPMYRGENFFSELCMLTDFFNRVRYYFESLSPMKLSPWFSIGIIKTIQERAGELVPELKYDLGLL